MIRRRCPRRACRPLAALLAVCVLVVAGCDVVSLVGADPNVSVLLPFLGATASNATSYREIESNNEFETATPIALDENGRVRIQGSLDEAADVDTFDLGSADPGDRFILTAGLAAARGAAVALFDENGDLIRLFRQSNPPGHAYSLEAICRGSTSGVRVAVAALEEASVLGEYSLAVQRLAWTAPGPVPQAIVLDFDGEPAAVVAGGPPIAVPAFDAARIDARFAGQTEIIQQKVLAAVREHFNGLNVTVRSSSDGPRAVEDTSSVIYFGTDDPDLLGLADNVDTYNDDPSQAAIVFTDTFSLFAPLDPSVDEIAQVLANVASHEAGHLLGLWHVSDPARLMDTTATARQMLRPQTFGRALLGPSVFPIGWQNDATLLARTVGGSFEIADDTQLAVKAADDWRREVDFQIDRFRLSKRIR